MAFQGVIVSACSFVWWRFKRSGCFIGYAPKSADPMNCWCSCATAYDARAAPQQTSAHLLRLVGRRQQTYAMLAARSRALKAAGLDVLAGVIKTRPHRGQQHSCRGSMCCRPRSSHRAAARCRSSTSTARSRLKYLLILVDELARAQQCGRFAPPEALARHREELLQGAGIDVYTTLNVQHLEKP
jgi:hypothetical protein